MVVSLILASINAQNTANIDIANTLAGCQAFAAEFDNTCAAGSTPASLADVPKVAKTCANVGECPDSGEVTGYYTWDSQECTFNRQLCVYCTEENSKVYITVQSNGMPNHCWVSPL